MADDPGGLMFGTSQWFDDWREWVEWLAAHGAEDAAELRQRKLADGREELGLIQLVAHYTELNTRACARATFHNTICGRFGLTPQQWAALPATRQHDYVRLPKSPIWGHVRGMYIKRQAYDVLCRTLEEQASEPLHWRSGVRCPKCGKQYPGYAQDAAAGSAAGDPFLADRTAETGLSTYRCLECGFVFVWFRGRGMRSEEALGRLRGEAKELTDALAETPRAGCLFAMFS